MSSTFRAHYYMHSEKSAISLSMDGVAFPTVGSLVIVFQVRNSVRPMHLFGHTRDHDYYFELPVKGSGIPNQLLGDRLHTIAISGLSRVSVWACGPLNLMKISSSQMQNRTGSERRD